MAESNTGIPTPDLSELIDLGLLQLFGERTIVPMLGTISTLGQAVSGLSNGLDGVESSIAPVETSPAQTAHAVGTYLMYAGELYKAKTAIAVGDTLTVGTNIEKTTVIEVAGSGGGGDVSELEARVDDCEQNILALTLALAIEQGAAVDGTSDNIVVEVFADASGYIVASGAYDSTNHRLYA